MKIRVINAGATSPFFSLGVGINVISVGDFVHNVAPGDGLLVYTTQNDHVTCDVSEVCLVVSADKETGVVTVDVRQIDVAFSPDRHALSKWRQNPYLAPDKAKVQKYGFLELFASVCQADSMGHARLEDSVRFVFRPDLTIPTLNPVEGHVYLFRRPDLYKIGKTTDLQRRQRDLGRQHGVPLVLPHSFVSNDYTRAEGELLAKYRPKLREGVEWFALDSEDVEFICSITDYGMDS